MTTDTRLGHELAGYRLEALLGQGGMGVVYRAHDPELNRPVALKVIAPELAQDPAFAERFLREIEVAASLEHPHVCPVYRAGEAEGELYVCMRLLEAGTLADKVAAEGPLSPERTAEIVSHLASALDLAHSRSLLHRDVKAENVLLDREGNAYLADFGLAGAIWQADEQAQLAGTLAYLAPERCQGSPALPASDQYALACLVVVLLSGQPPFVREHEAALLYAHLREDPSSLEAHGLARLDPVLAQALAKDPAERYPSCSEFADELDAAIARPERAGIGAWPEGLPRPATRLVGRTRELRELAALLPDTRLLTLTGTGGTGKTRLALQAAAEAAPAFADGVSWVSLAPLRDPAHVLSAIAQALAIQEQPSVSLQDALEHALAGKDLLLVLDNAEHLLPEIADDVARLRDISSGPTLLCTSRERLDLQAERLYPVPTLAEPEAAELFSDRASYLDPAHDADDPAIASLCERLDALPLALELAAARSDLYSPRELVHALEGHLELLRGARDHDPRHRTLAATIAWSYDLLSAEEQSAFRALSVFAGDCTAQAAHEVALADLALLQSLGSKSLLRTREAATGRRYFMLETVRHHAAERLGEAGEEAAASERHAAHYCSLAVVSEDLLRGETLANTVDRLHDDVDNIRAALGHDELLNAPRALTVASVLCMYWLYAGGIVDAYRLLRRLLEADLDLSDGDRASALVTTGTLAYSLGDLQRAAQDLHASILLLRGLDDARLLASALNNHAAIATELGDLAVAEVSYEESASIYRAEGDMASSAGALGNLAMLVFSRGKTARARALAGEALELKRANDSPVGVAISLVQMAEIAFREGAVDEAREYASEGLELIAGHEARWSALALHAALAGCECAQGRSAAAQEQLRAALDDYRALGSNYFLTALLEPLAEYAVPSDASASAQFLGRIDGVRDERGGILMWYEADRRERLLARLTDALGDERLQLELAAGARLSDEDALALAERIRNSSLPPEPER